MNACIVSTNTTKTVRFSKLRSWFVYIYYVLHSIILITNLFRFQRNNKIQLRTHLHRSSLIQFVIYLLHFFFSGVTVSVETEYSRVMSRHYLNVNFIPTATFARNTEGLCGFMDDDDTNDLTGPNGEQYNDTIQFAESCKYHSGSRRAHFGRGEGGQKVSQRGRARSFAIASVVYQ